MKFNKELSFGQIISHVFPGFVFVLLVIVWFIKHNNWDFLEIQKYVLGLSWNSQTSIFVVFIFIGTIFGVLIDAAHHCIDDLLERFKVKEGVDLREYNK